MSEKKFKIGLGALLFEGNTFSSKLSSIQEFDNRYHVLGDAIPERLQDTTVELAGAIAALSREDVSIQYLSASNGGSGGKVTRQAHEILRDELIASLEVPAELDGLYLALHGAMICEDEEDPEGALLERIRKQRPWLPIIVSCDLHAHVTPRMVANCDAIIGYQHYPHDDTFETGMRAAGLLLRQLRGLVRPVMRMHKVAALISPYAGGTKEPGVMREIFEASRALEVSGDALAVSYFTVQPWLDLPDIGTAFVVVTDDDHVTAEGIADDLSRRFWSQRHRFAVPQRAVEVAFNEAASVGATPVVLVELADCVGGGAAGDSVQVLDAYLRGDRKERLLIHVVDPDLCVQAARQGVGATFSSELGQKIDATYAKPITVTVTVESLFDGQIRYKAGPMGGIRASIGPSAVVSIDTATILVSTYGAYEYGEESFEAAGLDVRNYDLVVVKNPMNSKQAYAWAPRLIPVKTKGSTTSSFDDLPWLRLSRPCFPLDDSEIPLNR